MNFFDFTLNGRIELSDNVDLDIFFALEDCLHDFDIIAAEDGDIIIILIEEGDVKRFRGDVELLAGEVDDFFVVKCTSIEFDFFFEFENKLHS